MPRSCQSGPGFTLVEVAWSCLLLTLLCLAAGAFATTTCKLTEVAATKRAALEAASSRLEDVRGAGYADIAPVALTYETNYLSRSGSTWTRSLSSAGENVRLNERICPMVTTVQYVDMGIGTSAYECVRVSVRIGHFSAAGESVELETMVTP